MCLLPTNKNKQETVKKYNEIMYENNYLRKMLDALKTKVCLLSADHNIVCRSGNIDHMLWERSLKHHHLMAISKNTKAPLLYFPKP